MNDAVLEQILSKGFTPESAASKTKLFEACSQALGDLKGVGAWFVPGRVEVLGKHTDYCGGRSVVSAVDQGIVVLCRPRTDGQVTIVDAGFNDSCQFALADDLTPTVGHWSNYPMTVARRVARDFPGALVGADIAIASDLVPASGMSSSSALIIAVFLALSYANRLDETELYQRELGDPTKLASYVAAIEGGKGYGPFRADHGVGTAGGSEDHTAILCSIPGKLGVFSYRPVRLECYVDFPADHVLVICSSGVVAEKTGAAMKLYNRASRLASEGSAIVARKLGANADDFATLARDYEEGQLLEAMPDEATATRFRHFNSESNRIIPQAIEALANGDLSAWGKAVEQSQHAGESLLGNQVTETVFLARSAQVLGAVAASAFGAGFGGSVWAMVQEASAQTFVNHWRKAYLTEFPTYTDSAKFFATRPGPAAFSINL